MEPSEPVRTHLPAIGTAAVRPDMVPAAAVQRIAPSVRNERVSAVEGDGELRPVVRRHSTARPGALMCNRRGTRAGWHAGRCNSAPLSPPPSLPY